MTIGNKTGQFKALDYINTQEQLDAFADALCKYTIERCAQVAEWEGYATVGRQIAARIRALKDKP